VQVFPGETLLLIAPMEAGITDSRCPFCEYPGEILMIILWMSYFRYPHLVSLPEARENRFSTGARAKFQQGKLKMDAPGAYHGVSARLWGSGEASQGAERRVIHRLIKRVTETTSGLLLTSCRMATNVHHVLELVMPYRREGEFL